MFSSADANAKFMLQDGVFYFSAACLQVVVVTFIWNSIGFYCFRCSESAAVKRMLALFWWWRWTYNSFNQFRPKSSYLNLVIRVLSIYSSTCTANGNFIYELERRQNNLKTPSHQSRTLTKFVSHPLDRINEKAIGRSTQMCALRLTYLMHSVMTLNYLALKRLTLAALIASYLRGN